MSTLTANTVETNSLQAESGTGEIALPTGHKIVAADAEAFSQPYFSGQVIQIQTKRAYATSGHISVTSTSFTSLPLTIDITVKDASSSIDVIFYSDMQYGASNILTTDLRYSTDAGSTYTDLTPTSTYLYYWMYNAEGWQPVQNRFLHTHGHSVGTTIRYQLQYRNWNSTSTNYLVHNTMGYGWHVTEIAG